MKKAELKNILKPLIKECVKEAILEDGVLSGIVREVARGIADPVTETAAPVATDPVATRMTENAFNNQQKTKLQEHKNKLMSAIGTSAYNGVDLFEGTMPAASETSPQQMAAPLAGQAPTDPGVDIGKLFGSVGRNWNAHMSDVKEGK
tara:strand:- start:33132 stop:33575 length:444 start_codon:yes stop_codon:yes gene_type:complete